MLLTQRSHYHPEKEREWRGTVTHQWMSEWGFLYLETSGVENECLLTTSTHLWQEYENTEFLQSRQWVIIIIMVYFWSDDDMALELGYNRNGHPEFRAFRDNTWRSSSYVRVLGGHQEKDNIFCLFIRKRKAASGLGQNVIATTPDASCLENKHAFFLWGGMVEYEIYPQWG